MKKTILFLAISLISAITFLKPINLAWAQASDPATNLAIKEETLAKIVEQKDTIFKISFNWPGGNDSRLEKVTYAVSLVTDKTKIDEKIYPEVLNLAKNQTWSKEIIYEAPAYLQGTFWLRLSLLDTNGTRLAIISLGDVDLNGDGQFLEINKSSCYLKVAGEAGDKKYNLEQRVDIEKNEKLIAYCEIINHYDKAIVFTPKFETYWHNTYGKLVKDNQESQTAASLKPQEKKEVSFVLPKAENPQSYDAVLTLLEGDKVVSNAVDFYYVLRGSSATIQSVELEKDYYAKGETAKVSFFWAPLLPANPRLGAIQQGALTAQIDMINKDGQPCIKSLNKELDSQLKKSNSQGLEESLALAITANCINPQVNIVIKDAGGRILDQRIYSLESQNIPPAANQNQLKRYGFWGAAILSSLMISILIMFYFQKKSVITILFFLLVGGGFMGNNVAEASTELICYNGECRYRVDGTWEYQIRLNKTAYFPGEQIAVTTYGYNVLGCDSGCAGAGTVSPVVGVINSVSQEIVPGCGYEGVMSCVSDAIPDQYYFQPPHYFTAESVPGTYYLMTYRWLVRDDEFIVAIPYTVVPPPDPVPGECGSAAEGVFCSPPDTNLCADGTKPPVSGTGPYSWTCPGLFGGEASSCTTKAPGCSDVPDNCSVPCGGGKKIIKHCEKCVDKVLTPYDITKVCNSQPCPPGYKEVVPW